MSKIPRDVAALEQLYQTISDAKGSTHKISIIKQPNLAPPHDDVEYLAKLDANLETYVDELLNATEYFLTTSQDENAGA
jgi:hypothetical protein